LKGKIELLELMAELARLKNAVDADRSTKGLSHLTGVRPSELVKDHLTPSGLLEYFATSQNPGERTAHRYIEMAFGDLRQSVRPVLAVHFDELLAKLQASPAALHKFLDDTIADSANRTNFESRLASADASVRRAAKDDLKVYLAAKLDADPTTMLKLSEYLSPYSSELDAKYRATNGLISTSQNALLAEMLPGRAAANPNLNSGNPAINSLLSGALDEAARHPILTATVVAAAVAALLESTKVREEEERRALLKILDEKEASNARIRELEGNYPELSSNGSLDRYKSSDPRVILTLAAAADLAAKTQHPKTEHPVTAQ
jgi:hypothetical protein